MPRINLLPWREELRKERQKNFAVATGIAIVFGVLVVMFSNYVYNTRIEYQNSRNQLLRGEITALDAQNSIYDIPMMLHDEDLDDIVIERLGLEDRATRPADLSDWEEVVDRLVNTEHEVTVAMVGKYVDHADAYKSLTEAITHGGLRQRIKVNIVYYESEDFADGDMAPLENVDAILVPGGFGERGFEGKVNAIRHARENGIPYLGICYGMQAAAVEFARNVCGLEGANTTENEADTPHPVIGLITEWRDASGTIETRDEDSDLGGTMRLGLYPAKLQAGTKVARAYQEATDWHRACPPGCE